MENLKVQDLAVNLIQSPNDKNLYKIIRLGNDLDCILVSNPETDKSAASLSVDAGQLDDPDQREGLAHFLEHMLFLGTEKYPNQNEYNTYLNQHSGSDNAYTSGRYTNYFFEVAHDALYGALDRFAQFFVKPLFTESLTEREMNAVNSENEMYRVNDSWREYHLFRLSGHKGNIYSRFGVGSLKSLKHASIREDLLKFYDERYSSNRMRLALFGREDLSTLEKWAHELFSEVKNKNLPQRHFKDEPFSKENLGNFWYLVPMQDNDYIEFAWVVEDTDKYYKSNPMNYLTHLFGHEGENSLLSLLKDEGLATELSAGHNVEMRLFTVITVRVKLTQKGLENYKDVISHTFRYLKMLKEDGVHKWIFEEIRKLKHLSFTFKEKQRPMGYVTRLSADMLYYPYQDILRLHHLMEEFDEKLIKSMIEALTLDNLRIYLISKKVEEKCNLTDEWYDVKHGFHKFNSEIHELFKSPSIEPKISKKKLGLPLPNTFLPDDLSILPSENQEVETPVKVYESEFSEVWFKKDNKFLVPKAKIIMRLYFTDNHFGYSIDALVTAKLWVELFREHLNETLYLASTAGFAFSFYDTTLGYQMDISGYSDTITNVLKEVFRKLLNFDPNDYKIQYSGIYDSYINELKNLFKKEAYNQALVLQENALKSSNYFHPIDMIKRLKNITFEDFLQFHNNLFNNIRFDWLFSGNLHKDKVVLNIKETEEIMKQFRPKCQGIPREKAAIIRVVDLPVNQRLSYSFEIPNSEGNEPANPNSCFTRIYQVGEYTHHDRLLTEVAHNFFKEEFFNQLRTNEQLGYCTWASFQLWRGISVFYFLVQSDVQNPQYIAERVDHFLGLMKKKVEEMTVEEYEKHLESIRIKKLEKDYTLYEEASRLWNAINDHSYEFDRKLKDAERLKAITIEDLKKFVLKNFYHEQKSFETHVISEKFKEVTEKLREERKQKDSNYVEVKNFEVLKNKLKLHPDYYVLDW